ncbi:MAG: hypothetical protein ACKVT1_14435 [Dehalococcoidia bacterium]
MSSEPDGLREVVERNAQAVMTGNFAQIMADITPEALAQMMQQMPQAGQMSLTSMPAISGYEIEAVGPSAEAYVYNVIFASAMGTATLVSEWKQLLGQWKISAVKLLSIDPAPPAGDE